MIIQGCDINEAALHTVECPVDQLTTTPLSGKIIDLAFAFRQPPSLPFIMLTTDDSKNTVQMFNLGGVKEASVVIGADVVVSAIEV